MLSEQQIAERLSITSRAKLERYTKLLAVIQDGVVSNWKEAMIYMDTSWPNVRPILKKLRDAGLITASREYNHIAYKPEPKP